MPAKKQRGQKLDTTKLFGSGSQDENYDWAAGHNYDEEQPNTAQGQDGKARSPNADGPRVAITKAAAFGNFRDDTQKISGVPPDMEAPFVAFVKTFGRGVNEEAMKSYFTNMVINNCVIINNDKALFAFIEFDSREDLANALLVTGAKMMYQYPCTVDVAAPEQIQKYQNAVARKQPRSMMGRSPTSPKPGLNFDRDAFQQASQPDVDLDELANEGEGGEGGRGGRGGRGGGGFRGMSKSGSANFDAGRDSIFGSAEPVPENNGDNYGGGDGMRDKKAGRFAGNRTTVSGASAQFSEMSRDSVFGSASASNTASPNPSGRPQFGRNASKDSFESSDNNSEQQKSPKEAPAFSRDIFGAAEVPPPPPQGGEEGDNSEKKRGGGDNKKGGRDAFFGGAKAEGGDNNNNRRNNNTNKDGGNKREGFSRRSPTSQKEGGGADMGDKFGNFRNKDNKSPDNNNNKSSAPPPPPPATDSTSAGTGSKPSYAALAAGGNWRN